MNKYHDLWSYSESLRHIRTTPTYTARGGGAGGVKLGIHVESQRRPFEIIGEGM